MTTTKDERPSADSHEDDATLAEQVPSFLRTKLPDASDVLVEQLQRSVGGNSRENWLLDVSWADATGTHCRKLLLRRQPVIQSIASDLTREFAALGALAKAAPFPSPEPYWSDLGGEWFGRPSIIIERLPGSNNRAVLADESRPLAARVSLARQYAKTLGQLHAIDGTKSEFQFLDMPASVADAVARSWKTWASAIEADPEPYPVVAAALSWMRRHAPTDGPICLVHGDFRPGNTLVAGDRISAVLDWETLSLSDPAEDLAWYLLPTSYRREHFIEGAYTPSDFIVDYERAGGPPVDLERVRFWQVLAVIKMLETSAARVRQARALGVSLSAATGRTRAWTAWYDVLLADLINLGL